MANEVQDGPFTVWQMFNAPTMVLFNNLENSVDGLEKLLMSILKLSGDFSEVLIPRPGASKYPEDYYKAFNNWLIGRLFYMWSVKELNRIHILSKDAQLKILNILCLNGATFYNKIHYEYREILQELFEYYEDNVLLQTGKTKVLTHFSSERNTIPDTQLNLEPIYVNITSIEMCKKLINTTLLLLAESIPMDNLNMDYHISIYEQVFYKILNVLQCYEMDLKSSSLSFFNSLIHNYEKVAINKFCYTFPIVTNELMLSLEALIASMPNYYEECIIDHRCIEDMNNALVSLLKVINYYIEEKCKESLTNICTVILGTNVIKVFTKELRMYCLSLNNKLELPNNVIALRSMSFNENLLLSDGYANKIVSVMKSSQTGNSVDKIKEDLYYKEVLFLITSLNACENDNIDKCILNYHMGRCSLALRILEKVYIDFCKLDKQRNNTHCDIFVIPKENILKTVSNILEVHKYFIIKDIENARLMLNIIMSLVILYDRRKFNKDLVLQLTCLQPKSLNGDLEVDEEIKVKIIKYLLMANIILKSNENFNKKTTWLLNSLMKNKSIDTYNIVIKLSPLLLINKVFFASKLIGDILLPAFLTKDVSLQNHLCKYLEVITCITFGKIIITLNKSKDNAIGYTIFTNNNFNVSVICSICHNILNTRNNSDEFYKKIQEESIVLYVGENIPSCSDNTVAAQKKLFAKFLKRNTYTDIDNGKFLHILKCFSNHTILNDIVHSDLIVANTCEEVVGVLRTLVDNTNLDENMYITEKTSMLSICINVLVNSTKNSLQNNDYNEQTYTLDWIKQFGLASNEYVLLPSTKLLIYFIMHPQCPLACKAVIYLRDICEVHSYTPHQVYHRYKKDYCKLFVDCSLYNGKDFTLALLRVVRAFGFVGYRDFISKDVHHFLPYLIPYSVKIKDVPVTIIEEIASLVQCSVADFLIERFPHVYTHVYLYEDDEVAKKCYDIIEKMTNTSILNLIKRHFRVILTEFLLQYCCNPEKVLNACRYLASHDPDMSVSSGNVNNMSVLQIADFLQPKFLGILAYFDHKLVNVKVALSVKRKALQSFPDIMNLMGVKYLTPLRFKVLATLRSALPLVKEFPKILATAWSAFIHNIDSMSLGPLLANLAVSLLQQFEYAPHEINKIFQYLVLNNENLLSAHISDLFFLEDCKISEKVKIVIKRHVKRTQPDGFLDNVKWYLQHLNRDIPNVKAHAFLYLDRLIKNNRTEIHKAIFGGKNIEPVIVELIDCLLVGCRDAAGGARAAAGACLGQLGAVEAAHLPRRYVQPERQPFAFSIGDDCFAATALLELTRAFQYEKDTMNMDCYALTIQEILKMHNISPSGTKKDIWNSFPEHMHQIMHPLLSSRYTLAYPSQPKKVHPVFGSIYASTFLEWAHNWTRQLIPLIESESVRELLRTAHPSMRRDARTLLLFLPYVLLHAVMSDTNTQYIQEEIQAVIGLENFQNANKVSFERNRYKILRHIRMIPTISSIQAEEGNQSKCCKMIYTLIDFLNRWLLEWCHSKQHPLQNENYKTISAFVNEFDKLTIARGNFICGEFERALQYLEFYMDETGDHMQNQLPFLAEIYALLDEPDSVAGILSIKRAEPSLKELILAQVVTGRLQDAALCYERLAQEGQLDRHSLQGMIDCYLGLDQPFTAYRLLNELEKADNISELAAEPLWRLGRFEQLEELVQKPVPPSRENWGLLMGRILLSFRSQDRDAFETSCKEGMTRLLAQMEGESKGESALRSGYQTVFGLHIIKEAGHAEDILHSLKNLPDGDRKGTDMLNQLLDDWRRRAAIVQSDARTIEPLLRCRRILLQQTQELLQPSHPVTANTLKSCIGDLWLQSAKHARKAGVFQQAYMYILNAEEYQPDELFIEKAKMYWARSQQEQAFTTLKRGLDDVYPQIESLSQEQRKICAKAKLLIAKYNDETTNVDVDVNIDYYKEAVNVYKQWEKSLVCLGAYYEKVSSSEGLSSSQMWSRRIHALNSYGKALQYGHKYLYQSMPRMLSIWLDMEVTSADPALHTVLTQMTEIIKTYSERLPLYLYLTAFSQIVSRICHPVKEVYLQVKAILVKLILAYPQHTLWMMMCVIKSSYPQRKKRCQEVFADPRLQEPQLLTLVRDFTVLAEKLIELCNKPIGTSGSTTTVSSLVSTLPRLLTNPSFSHIMMPFQEFCKIVLPSKAARQERIDFDIPAEPPVYIRDIDEHITILPSLQKPRKVTLKGSDGRAYAIMLKPRDDLRKDYRLMEFNGVVNRFLRDAAATRRRRLYLRTYCVLPLNEECGLIEWLPGLLGLRPVLVHIYKQRGIHTSNRELKDMMCSSKDPVEKKRKIFEEQLLPRHPPVFQEWFKRVFSDPYGWYQARSAYIRTTAVISMVGYILGLGDRHGENISFDSKNGDTVHVDFNCLFNKGEAFEWPERVPFRLTHNMESAMGPLKHEGMFRKSCEAVMRALRAQTAALMSVVGPFVYDPLVSWGRARDARAAPERTNEQALQHLLHIRQRLNGMVRTKNKQLSLSLSVEGQVEHLIVEATSVHNLCQMYIGWGPFL